MRKKICLILKVVIIISSLVGVVLGCILFERDGYSAWYKRLYYFTNMSNLWICAVMIGALWATFVKRAKYKRVGRVIYICKYIFTVSIAITGIIFCGLLAPFAEDGYHAWSINSLLLHVVTPVLSVVDFFVDDYNLALKTRYLFLTIIPPLLYFVFAIIMGVCGVDFGKGETYPYFFFDFNNPAGLFGFIIAKPRPFIGSFYWLLVVCLLVFGLGALFKKISPKTKV